MEIDNWTLEELRDFYENQLGLEPGEVPHYTSLSKRLYHDRICAIFRLIYHNTDDEKLKYLMAIATTMAKKMSRKLEEYKNNAKK